MSSPTLGGIGSTRSISSSVTSRVTSSAYTTPSRLNSGEMQEIETQKKRRAAEKHEIGQLNTRFGVVVNSWESREILIKQLTDERDEARESARRQAALWDAKLAKQIKEWGLVNETLRSQLSDQDVLKTDNSELRNANNRLQRQVDEWKKKHLGTEKNLNIHITQHQSVVESSKQQMEKLRADLQNLRKVIRDKERNETERDNVTRDALTKEFARNLLEAEARWQAEQDSWISSFRDEMDKKFRNNEAESMRLHDLIETLRAQNKSLDENCKRLRRAESIADERARKAEDELALFRSRGDNGRDKLHLDLNKLHEAYRRKCLQFDILMDEKLKLDDEIAQYRSLLIRAENCEGLTHTPLRKRYKPSPSEEWLPGRLKQPDFGESSHHITTYTSSSSSTTNLGSTTLGSTTTLGLDSHTHASLAFVELLAKDKALVIGNKSHTNVADLRGWRLIDDNQKTLDLSKHSTVLEPNGRLYVTLSEHNAPDGAIVWSEWQGSGANVIELVSPKGDVVAKVDLKPFRQRQECFIM